MRMIRAHHLEPFFTRRFHRVDVILRIDEIPRGPWLEIPCPHRARHHPSPPYQQAAALVGRLRSRMRQHVRDHRRRNSHIHAGTFH